MALRKRSVLLAGHATSVALEQEFWDVLDAVATIDALTLAGLIARIDAGRGRTPLASACRLAALDHLRQLSLVGAGVRTGS